MAVDAQTRKIVRKVALPAEPINLELRGDPPDTLVVRYQQLPFGAQDLTALPCDQEQYGGPGPHTSAALGRDKTYSRLRDGVVKVSGPAGDKQVDVSSVTKLGEHAGGLSYPLKADGGPTHFAICAKYLFFTSPANGRLGVIDTADDRLVKAIDIGGWLSDLIAVPAAGLVYVADAQGGRVVVVDANKLEVAREVKVAEEPWALAYFQRAEIQRPQIVPPARIEKVYVACRAGKRLICLDAQTSAVLGSAELPAPARFVRPVPLPNSGWWPLLPDDRIGFALTPKVAVELWPTYLHPETLAPVESSAAEAGEPAVRHSTVQVTLPGQEKPVEIYADNSLLLKVGDRWVDASNIADPQLVAGRPLTTRDVPGSMIVSVDGGPAFNWTRGLWMTPDSQMFLVNDSDEYWLWNAPSFTVGPGKHTLSVRLLSPHARLDAVAVCRSPENWLDVNVQPLPREIHSKVPLPGYQGLFYYNEPVAFELTLKNLGKREKALQVRWEVTNYLDELAASGKAAVRLAAGGSAVKQIAPSLKDMGRFKLVVHAVSDDGVATKVVRFARLPRLEHPRLLMRREDVERIQQAVQRYPRLYQRYVDWLRRMAPRGGKWPDRFLPPGLTREEMGAAAPDDIKDKGQREQAYGWRMYEPAWRMLAVEFAAMYLAPQHRDELLKALEPLFQAQTTSYYCQYHHHGPFFPGAVACLVDMAPDEIRGKMPLVQFLKQYRGDMNVFPWTLVTLEEPLTPEDRALIWKFAIFEDNLDQYFTTRCGSRGGTWWQNPFTGCHCPIHGLELTFVYLRSFFGEPRLFERPYMRGFLTFQRYLDPIRDNRRLLPSRRGPLGEPWRWILCALTRHPLEKVLYRWDEWVEKLNGPLPDETQSVDELMALKGMPYVGPMRGGQHHFTTGVVVPIALALGWYDPDAPTVQWEELPPTAIFDVEGWAVMRSGWDENATEVYFTCGLRDHTPRQVPGHFMIWKAGEALIGWPALWGDDGNNTPMWGNVVVAGDKWADRWRMNLSHPRDGEHFVINRFSQPTWTYIDRDRKLIGYKPAESGWGGGLDFHGHTETMYMREGSIIGYLTRPEFDYVAGDGSNAWPTEEILESYRQLVYVRPDTVVVYDRVRLGKEAGQPALVLATGSDARADGQVLQVRSGQASLRAIVLLPEQARIDFPTPLPHYQWKGQQMAQIEPSTQTGDTVEYLVVYRTGGAELPSLDVRLVREADQVGVAWVEPDGRPIEIRFNRPGRPLGGVVTMGSGATALRQELPTAVEDTYRYWASYPMYRAWVAEPRFDFVVPPVDRNRTGR
ncbi:MAG: hypothetical protein H5T86_05225 [Armatimonadetes bacterium]|nr:hypothetical protein [Armatimonadota bacterium]